MKTRRIISTVLLLVLSSGVQAENISQLYQIAKQNDPLINKQHAQYGAELEAKPQARSRFFPTVGTEAGISGVYLDQQTFATTADEPNDGDLFPQTNPIKANDTFEKHQAAVTIAMPIFRLENHVNLARADATVSRANMAIQVAEQDLMVRVPSFYFGVLGAYDKLKFNRIQKSTTAQTLSQSKDKFNAGLVSDLDVQEAQARYDKISADEFEAANELRKAIENLREVIGEYTNVFNKFNSQAKLAVPQPADIDAWSQKAIANSYQIKTAEDDVKIAYHTKHLSDTGHWPTLDLVQKTIYIDSAGGVANGAEGRGTTFPVTTTQSETGLQLNMPLFQGNFVTSRSREAAKKHEGSQFALTEMQRSVVNSTRHAYLETEKNIRTVGALKQAIRSAESAMRATEQGLDAGIRTTAEVLNAQQQFHLQNLNLSLEQYRFVVSSLLLKQAAGILSETDLKEADGLLSVAEFSPAK